MLIPVLDQLFDNFHRVLAFRAMYHHVLGSSLVINSIYAQLQILQFFFQTADVTAQLLWGISCMWLALLFLLTDQSLTPRDASFQIHTSYGRQTGPTSRLDTAVCLTWWLADSLSWEVCPWHTTAWRISSGRQVGHFQLMRLTPDRCRPRSVKQFLCWSVLKSNPECPATCCNLVVTENTFHRCKRYAWWDRPRS